MTRLALLMMAWATAVPAYAVTIEDCRRTFDALPTELAWCLASVGDESKCRNHPKLSPTEETFCWAAASGYGKCSVLGGDDAPARIACEALAKDRWSECADAVSDELEKKGGDELEAAKAAAAFCWAFTKPVKGTCAGANSGDFLRARCEAMVDARLVTTGKVAPVQALPPLVGGERDSLTPPPPDSVSSSDDGKVADWAREEYINEAPRTLICSMTSDGKIGSIYFDDGRIRTVHASGPEESVDTSLDRWQFNIDSKKAAQVYHDQVGKRMPYTTTTEKKDYWRGYNRWLVAMLAKGTEGSFPDWVSVVEGPETALDVSEGPPSKDLQLVEIFFNINGRVEKWHPSRGAAVKFETNQQVISVLKAALKHIEDEGLVDPDERNQAFYDFLKSRLPNLETDLNVRSPDEL
jgi:hypothetical protein